MLRSYRVGTPIQAFSLLLLMLLLSLLLSACNALVVGPPPVPSGVVPVVAAENFYGDIVKQIGGSRVSVVSMLSDPNADPHEYEASVQSAIEVSRARLVIENGAGYDSWMDRLLTAAPSDQRIVLVATSIAPQKLPDNPHVWYSLTNVTAIAQQISDALGRIEPTYAASFAHNLAVFMQSLDPVYQKMASIHAQYNGTSVGLTETIFLYQTGPLGLRVLTPQDFQKAIAEGNDPPAVSVAIANTQIQQRAIRVLIYNLQTVTPITTNLQQAALAQHIPLVGVTETMPKGQTYQQWMLKQLTSLEQALHQA